MGYVAFNAANNIEVLVKEINYPYLFFVQLFREHFFAKFSDQIGKNEEGSVINPFVDFSGDVGEVLFYKHALMC